MGKRYGRNQKRKHKALIEELATEVNYLQWLVKAKKQEVEWARQGERRAVNTAFQRYADNHGLIVDAVQRIAYHLGSGLPEHLKPHLEKIAPHYVENGLKFHAQQGWQESKTVQIRGTIESFNYQITTLDRMDSMIK